MYLQSNGLLSKQVVFPKVINEHPCPEAQAAKTLSENRIKKIAIKVD